MALLVVAALSGLAAARSYRQALLPNTGTVLFDGQSLVPDPFQSSFDGKCYSLGHNGQCAGVFAGANAFGNDFVGNGESWAAVCAMDSDGDGKTNGDELGDSCCVWNSPNTGLRARFVDDVSHPGTDLSTTGRMSCSGAPPANVPNPVVNADGAMVTLSWDAVDATVSCHCAITVEVSSDGGATYAEITETVDPDATAVMFAAEGATTVRITTSNLAGASEPVELDLGGEPSGPSLALQVGGDCATDSSIDVRVTVGNATPDGGLALVYGSIGDNTVTAGSCAGTPFSIVNESFLRVLANANGVYRKTFSGLGAGVCGVWVQIVDLTSCEVSSTVQIV